MSMDNEKEVNSCGCGSGDCCGSSGKQNSRSRMINSLVFAALMAAAALLIIRGMTKNTNCAPDAGENSTKPAVSDKGSK